MEITWETLKNIPGEALDQLVLDDAKIAIYGIDKDGNQTNTSSRVVAVATITPWGKFFKGVKSAQGITEAIKDVTKMASEARELKKVIQLKPSGLGVSIGARVTANSLIEKLAMEEIMSHPQGGVVLIERIEDLRWYGWSKMSNRSAHGVEIHYVAKFKDGIMTAIDDFKFKN